MQLLNPNVTIQPPPPPAPIVRVCYYRRVKEATQDDMVVGLMRRNLLLEEIPHSHFTIPCLPLLERAF